MTHERPDAYVFRKSRGDSETRTRKTTMSVSGQRRIGVAQDVTEVTPGVMSDRTFPRRPVVTPRVTGTSGRLD